MKVIKQYFFLTFLTFVLATASFFVFKEYLPKRLFPESKTASKNVVIDSLLLDAVSQGKGEGLLDTISKDGVVTFRPQDGIVFPGETVEDYNGYQYLIDFYEKLYQLQSTGQGKVRIAYFSDSMTDGDMIVQDFRKFFQEKYGGEGVGFVNVTSESAASRSSIKHEFSQNWKSVSYLKVKKPVSPFGINGHVFFANDTLHNTWVRYKASKMSHITSLPKPTLFYGYSENQNGKVYRVQGEDTIYYNLSPNKRVNTLAISNSNLSSLQLNFSNAENIPIYGMNFDNGVGVHVDNFSSRGNSGLPLSLFNTTSMNAFQDVLNYDLIILHYGTNVLNYGSLNYSWYENKMNKVVEHLRTCFPNANFLIISTADKATKYDLVMKTDSAVVPLMKAQRKYSIASQTGFVNLYKKMGGEGSMVKWVDSLSKANKDYTHFNYKGSIEIAKLIFNELDAGFNEYKKLRVNKPIKTEEDSEPQTDSIYAE